MAIHSLQKGQAGRPKQRVHDMQRYPAPIRGIDARVSLTEGAILNCVFTYNLVPFEYGMAVRKGYGVRKEYYQLTFSSSSRF